MKTLLSIFAMLMAASGNAHSDEQSFREALISLPAQYFADIPLADRNKLLKTVAKNNARLDVEKGWLRWFSDGSSVPATSMLWAKELPRTGKPSLIFLHMAKPFASETKPETNQTFVLEPTDKGWIDVTGQVIPGTVDMTMHFRTRRDDAVIEAAPWKEFERRDGRGKAWTYGERTIDLHWNGENFTVENATSKSLTKN